MSQLPYVTSFRDLLVYQKSRGLSRAVFEATKGFPREEMFSLTDQIRRSSRSVGGQCAEAWAKRRYERHFISKLTDADGEQLETQHWIEVAHDCGYLSPDKRCELIEACEEIGRLLGGMIAKSDRFCSDSQQSFREPDLQYFVQPESDH